MKNLLLSTLLICGLFACNTNSNSETELDSVEVETDEVNAEIAQEKTSATRSINVSETSTESFLLVTDTLEYKSLLAYFPDSLEGSCELKPDSEYNLVNNLDALHFSQRVDNHVQVTKITSMDIGSLENYTKKPLSSLQKNAGGKLIFYSKAGDNNDEPMIYGENDVRDLNINDNSSTNPAYGINLNVQDAYLILEITNTSEMIYNLSILYNANNSSNACISIDTLPNLYFFNGCKLDFKGSPLYTKCKL